MAHNTQYKIWEINKWVYRLDIDMINDKNLVFIIEE